MSPKTTRDPLELENLAEKWGHRFLENRYQNEDLPMAPQKTMQSLDGIEGVITISIFPSGYRNEDTYCEVTA